MTTRILALALRPISSPSHWTEVREVKKGKLQAFSCSGTPIPCDGKGQIDCWTLFQKCGQLPCYRDKKCTPLTQGASEHSSK